MKERFMVKIEVAKPINFNELITSKEAEVVSMRILNQPNSYISLFSLAKDEEITAEAMLGNRYYYCFNGNGEIFIENNKKVISNGDFLEITANHNYSIEARDNLKLIEIGEKIGEGNMENKTLKMLESASAFNLAEVVEYQEGKIVSKNLVAKPNLVMTIMSFWKGESLDPHKAPGDALVTVLDGALYSSFLLGSRIPYCTRDTVSVFLSLFCGFCSYLCSKEGNFCPADIA